jgi:hypothetical protein
MPSLVSTDGKLLLTLKPSDHVQAIVEAMWDVPEPPAVSLRMGEWGEICVVYPDAWPEGFVAAINCGNTYEAVGR